MRLIHDFEDRLRYLRLIHRWWQSIVQVDHKVRCWLRSLGIKFEHLRWRDVRAALCALVDKLLRIESFIFVKVHGGDILSICAESLMMSLPQLAT
jgi:hypothetical protein